MSVSFGDSEDGWTVVDQPAILIRLLVKITNRRDAKVCEVVPNFLQTLLGQYFRFLAIRTAKGKTRTLRFLFHLPVEPATLGIGKAVEQLVASLPPKERACILLKDVFDYSLEEIAELVDTTVGGVKAALNRGRRKLASSPAPQPARTANPDLARIMQLYVDRFNRRDWDGVRELISADARLSVADRFAGKFADAPYFFNYDRWPWPWKLALGELDGEPVVIIIQRGADAWTSYSAIRMNAIGQKIDRIADYIHCPWLIPAAASVSLAGTT